MKLARRVATLVVTIAISLLESETGYSGNGLDRSNLTNEGANLTPATSPYTEYPRPIMGRQEWQNLNGSWDFGISYWKQTNSGSFDGQIRVPFPEESKLSGTKCRLITGRQRLWYRRTFTVPKEWRDQHVLLHFEAVDWETKVWLNGKELGVHQGGYDRFSFDITEALKPEGEQRLVVSVYDPTDDGFQPRGKQVQHRKTTFYGASSGIWQTVWLEPVPANYIESLWSVPDIDNGKLDLTVSTRSATNGLLVEAVVLDGQAEVSRTTGLPGTTLHLPVPHAKLWSPDHPFLYDLKVDLLKDGKEVDSVSSYFGMRQISIARDAKGIPRLMLNHHQLFELGPLDQGYWMDGLYTAPSDEAMRYDIEVMKQLGFNLCRKHVKVEPDRWYYWCDKLGLLVWQDMPSGDRVATAKQKEIKRSPESALLFEHLRIGQELAKGTLAVRASMVGPAGIEPATKRL